MSKRLTLMFATVALALCTAPLASAASKTKTSTKVASTTTSVSAPTGTTCPSVTSTTIFSRWGDLASYFLAPGGSMEDTTLWPGGSFVAENEPYLLAGFGTKSLRLTAGQSATSPWICQGSAYPTMRFMVRNAGSTTATLNVVMYISGIPGALDLGTVPTTATWAPSPIITLPTGFLPDGVTIPQVEVAFVASGAGADFRIDDVFVDPRSRG
jgi:hypothetical protein